MAAQENSERDFSIEITSNKHGISTLSFDANDGFIIEGTLGRLQHAAFIEPEILEVKGSCGVLRVNLRRGEIRASDTSNKCVGGDTECN